MVAEMCCSSSQASAENPTGGRKGHGGDDQQGPKGREQEVHPDVLEENAFDDDDEVGQRVEPVDVLQPKRHILNRGRKPGEQDCRHHKTEDSEKGLLLSGAE